MNRRGFLGAILAAASAPAIVKAENLMKIVAPRGQMEGLIILDEFAFLKMPETYEDGIIISEAFNRKLANNAISGAHVPSNYLNLYGKESLTSQCRREFELADKINAMAPSSRRRYLASTGGFQVTPDLLRRSIRV